jgi:hypothetical protein
MISAATLKSVVSALKAANSGGNPCPFFFPKFGFIPARPSKKKTLRLLLKGFVIVVLPACLPACRSASSFPNGVEFLKSKGFGASSFAQVRYEGTLKNINQQLPNVLQALREFEVVPKRPIAPVYTISLEKGSAFESQMISIQVGEDGYGVIRHSREQTFFHCAALPISARAAFDESTIVLPSSREEVRAAILKITAESTGK